MGMLALFLALAPEYKGETAGAAHEAALPSKPSEERVPILTEATLTNRITKLEQASKLSQYQVALESARGLRKARELKRAESTLIQLLESPAGDDIKRTGLLELGLVMQEQKEFPKAQQIYSEYVRRYDKDPSVPEVLLRQAYLYREMGVPVLAMTKFYAVISTSLNLKLEEKEYYQRLVLRAQAEIAETHFLQGNYEDAIDYLNRLLKLESLDLERANVLYKLVQCYTKVNKLNEALATASLFLEKFPNHIDAPETRYFKVDILKKMGRNSEALAELDGLLKTSQAAASSDPEQWLYWQQRAGNAIANEFYKEGDLLSSMRIYNTLAEINPAPEWQLPAWYQIGLVYENLKTPQKALEMYAKIVARRDEVKAPNENLKAVLEMATWRKQTIEWEAAAKEANKRLTDIVQPDELVLNSSDTQ
jgi:tetratricopeptide (TPR) repeat protein